MFLSQIDTNPASWFENGLAVGMILVLCAAFAAVYWHIILPRDNHASDLYEAMLNERNKEAAARMELERERLEQAEKTGVEKANLTQVLDRNADVLEKLLVEIKTICKGGPK